ncbi:pectate lyase superfamily protein-domain-containing protein [Sphaerosporella brunnea]|uniref:Pectate lyase superfamily protein-domain-containing protein n=1 Tax=Sphaerosporella brunnea TaxID=1250544 RepID=A0A5J5EB01_9PEZI|nr:pectate lyase superfamily protein-domain-containing protein [Sphaerosporella brunnea]
MPPTRRFGIASIAVSLLTLLPIASCATIPQFARGIEDVAFTPAVRARSPYYTYTDVAASSFWLEDIQKQGVAAFNPNPSAYKVFRNVKDYGAKGDGTTDDTQAINAAIQDGTRCGNGCDSSTLTPALIYFPSGTYRVSAPIVAMYYSQLVGNAIDRPVIKGLPNFAGIALIDSDPYNSDGSNWYTNQNNFFRAIRNFVIDTTDMPAAAGTGIHWQVAQATSLVNLKFTMSTAAGNSHQGIFMDNGSGGFMSDLEFVGGKFGMWIGNQQFLTRDLKFSNCGTAIYLNWDWQWTFKSVDISNCQVGIDITAVDNSGGQGVGSFILLDSTISDTPIGIKTVRSASSTPASGGSAVLDNVVLNNVPAAVASGSGATILAGGSMTIDLWGQGRSYGKNGAATTVQGTMTRTHPKPRALLDRTGKIFERSRPQYTDVPASSFISVRSNGAKGDGITDDTAAIQAVFTRYGGNTNNIIYFDHGVYLVSNTIHIPVNTRVVGEVWAVIMAASGSFQDEANPVPVWQVGKAGDVGTVELQELVFQTRGPQPGAILLQWNSRDPAGQQGANAMWDVHFRVAGSRGTELEAAQCIKNPSATITPDPKCVGSFMHLHIAKTASVYIENCWAWTADHGLDAPFDQITVYNGRGILTESAHGPVWMYATAAEHNQLYQFQFQHTKNVFVATAQTETPYFQSNPTASVPFRTNAAWGDPDYSSCADNLCKKSWALRILDSSDVSFYSAGLYSFFENYGQDCIKTRTCQDSIVDIQNSRRTVLYNLNTIASSSMVTYNKQQVINSGDNLNSFAQTVMEFST